MLKHPDIHFCFFVISQKVAFFKFLHQKYYFHFKIQTFKSRNTHY